MFDQNLFTELAQTLIGECTMHTKSFMSAFSVALFFSTLFSVCVLRVSSAQNSNVTGTIASDTKWMKANGPYTLSGNVLVNDGVTLTVEPGVIVNLNSHRIVIDGTLVATGTSTTKILMNGGEIRLTSSSANWNEQISSGSIIENAIITNVTITVSSSVKICNSSIVGVVEVDEGSPYVLNNAIYGFATTAIYIWGGSPQIKNNHLIGGIYGNSSARFSAILNNSIEGEVSIQGGSPVISNNLITGLRRKMYLINNDTFPLNAPIITDSPSVGIGLTGYNFGDDKLYGAIVTDNIIVGCLTGICWNAGEGAIIRGNIIVNCTKEGLSIGSNAIIENNTISQNPIGINIYNFNNIDYLPAPNLPVILNNNIENNSQYNLYSYCGSNLNATYNWWGTTDEQSIKQTIYDYTFDSRLGIINSIPCLTAPNSEAYPARVCINLSSLLTSKPSDQIFSIESNSTISALFFDETMPEINFIASGLSPTTGFVRATILENLMPNSENIKVYLDGNQINYSITSSENSWHLSFAYNHSEHHVAIVFTSQSSVPEFSSWIVLTSIMIVTLVIIVCFKKCKY